MANNLQNQAIALRKEGNTYSEILKVIPVAKSTLSLWLRSANLSKAQIQRLSEKKLLAMRRGSQAKRNQRIQRTKDIYKQAAEEINKVQIDNEKLWLMGTMLYWAEGSKEKEHNIGVGIKFSNSDAHMICIFIKWLKECLALTDDRIVFEIYIHKNYQEHKTDITNYWANKLGYPIECFNKVYYKKHNVSSKRKNVGLRYHGQLVVRVRESTDLNRKIFGWIKALSL